MTGSDRPFGLRYILTYGKDSVFLELSGVDFALSKSFASIQDISIQKYSSLFIISIVYVHISSYTAGIICRWRKTALYCIEYKAVFSSPIN
jgi:hypothetical protein